MGAIKEKFGVLWEHINSWAKTWRMSRSERSKRVRKKGQHEPRPGAGRSQAPLGTRKVRMAGGQNVRGASWGRDPQAGAMWRILNFNLIVMPTNRKIMVIRWADRGRKRKPDFRLEQMGKWCSNLLRLEILREPELEREIRNLGLDELDLRCLWHVELERSGRQLDTQWWSRRKDWVRAICIRTGTKAME